jgi:hypothetical protein
MNPRPSTAPAHPGHVEDPKLAPFMNSRAVRDATALLEAGESESAGSWLRTFSDLLSPAFKLGTTVGFGLLLLQLLKVGRVPRMGSVQEVMFLLIAFCLVGLGAWLCMWLTFVVPGRVAVLSHPETDSTALPERFLGLGFYFVGAVVLWSAAYGVALPFEDSGTVKSLIAEMLNAVGRHVPDSLLLFLCRFPFEIAALSGCTLLAATIARILIGNIATKNDATHILNKIHRRCFVVVAGCRAIYLCSYQPSPSWSVAETLVWTGVTLIYGVLHFAARGIIQHGAAGRLRGTLNPDDLTLAGLTMGGPVYVAFLLVNREFDWSYVVLLAAIVAVNAWLGSPPQPLKSPFSRILLGLAFAASLVVLAPALSSYAMQRLGVGNLEVAQIRLSQEDFQRYAPPSSAILNRREVGEFVELSGLHLGYDLGNELVFQLPVRLPNGQLGRAVPWALPREKVFGYFPLAEQRKARGGHDR